MTTIVKGERRIQPQVDLNSNEGSAKRSGSESLDKHCLWHKFLLFS
jgi:hypothetical protein